MYDILSCQEETAVARLKRTLIHLDPADTRRLRRLADIRGKNENRRVTVSELVRRAIREFLARQAG
jgi:RecA-family ATPase